jgi:outer membrane protein
MLVGDMRPCTPRWRALAVVVSLAIPSLARADVLTRALASGDGGGGGSAATPPPSDESNDLVAWAGAPKPITLPELLQFVVQQAPALQNAKIDIAVAEAQIAETWARDDWRFQAQLNGSLSTSNPQHASQDNSVRQYGGNVDINRTFSTGGRLDIAVASNLTRQNNFFIFTFDQLSQELNSVSRYWLDTATVTFTQPLLKSSGSAIYTATERKAQIARDSLVLQRRLTAIQAVQTVVSAYWDLVLAERQVAITEQSLALARERLRVTQIGAKGGKIADAEIPAVQQIIATREEDVLNGELAVLNASIALRRATGLPIGAGELGLRVAPDLEIQDRAWSLAELVDRAYAASPELAQLAKQDQSASIDIEVAENGLLPQLDAALSLGSIGQDTTFLKTGTGLAELRFYTITGSLTFARSLEQRDVRNKVVELRTSRQKLRVNTFDIRAQYAQAMSRAVAQLELAKRRVVLSKRAIELANRNIKIETDRFNLGTRTNFDVLNRLEDLRQAELREAQAMIDWHKAETTVIALTGDILPTFGIQLP